MEVYMKKTSWLVPAIIVLSCVGVAGLWLGRIMVSPYVGEAAPARTQSVSRDFSMTDTSGRKVSLEGFQGKWLVLFFGFTSCPEACPTAMLNVGSAMREIGEGARNLQVVFVSIDPERDTPDVLKGYLANFGDNIVGLSGTAEETAAITKSFGVYYKKRRMPDGDYTMDHSTALYLVSPSGAYVRPYKTDTAPDELAREITSAMSTGK
jgi:protein SCO1/2